MLSLRGFSWIRRENFRNTQQQIAPLCIQYAVRTQSTQAAAVAAAIERDELSWAHQHSDRRIGRLEKIRRAPTSSLNEFVRRLRDGSKAHRELAKGLANARSFRLPIITAQMIIRQRESRAPTSISHYLEDRPAWRTRLDWLERKGIAEQDLQHWCWILQAKTDDEMVTRFVSTDVRKPIFLLLLMVGSDRNLQNPATFGSLLIYIAENYIKKRPVRQRGSQLPWLAQRRRLHNWDALDLDHFHLVLERLVLHCVRVWPAALVSVSGLAVIYMRDMMINWRDPAKEARCRNLTYNGALNLFRRSSPVSPLKNMKYNWKAQKQLLIFANSTRSRLLLSRNGLRAVWRVLLSLKKTPDESRTAVRAAKTWPPFRQNWDGLDERRRPEDYLSRSVKAGREMVQAGFLPSIEDLGLGALGGAMMGQLPSTQTRSLAPKIWRGRKQALNVYSTWAALVKATRNAEEAWRMFQHAPFDGLKPNHQVYAEMFEKLYAREVSAEATESLVPGDAKETWKTSHGNLTDFEIIRLQPPSPEELYAQMLHEGNRPVGSCLKLLLKNASSLDTAMRYLADSPFRKDALGLLDSSLRPASVKLIERIPRGALYAWIYLLCKLHSNDSRSVGRDGLSVTNIERAIDITFAAMSQDSQLPGHYKPMFRTILSHLAGSKTLFSRAGSRYNAAKTMRVFLAVYFKARELMGVDVTLAQTLAWMQHKTLRRLTRSSVPQSAGPVYVVMLETIHRKLLETFEELTRRVQQGTTTELKLPGLYFAVTPWLLYHYIRAFGALGDWENVVRVTDWILGTWDDELILEEAKERGEKDYNGVCTILGYVREMGARGMIPEHEIRRLDAWLSQLSLRTTVTQGLEVGYRWDWPEMFERENEVIEDIELARAWKKFGELVGEKPARISGADI